MPARRTAPRPRCIRAPPRCILAWIISPEARFIEARREHRPATRRFGKTAGQARLGGPRERGKKSLRAGSRVSSLGNETAMRNVRGAGNNAALLAGKAWAEARPKQTGQGFDARSPSFPGSVCAFSPPSVSLPAWQIAPGSKLASDARRAEMASNWTTLWRAIVAACSKIAAIANQPIPRRKRILTP